MSNNGWSVVWWLLGSMCIPITIPWLLFKIFQYKKMKENLKGKVVLITGASSGLGEALAHAFYKAGCRLILAARREAQLERVKKDLLSLHPTLLTHPPVIIPIDLSKIEEIPSHIEKIKAIFGHVDILINNAGISFRGDILSTKLDVDKNVMNVNYFGQIALTKALLSSMIDRRSGHIVAVSSVQGRISIPHRSAYAASKHALQAFCDCLRAEVAQYKINVTVVSPGYIRTNLSLNALTSSGQQYGVTDESTASGYSPDKVADDILSAVIRKKPELILSETTPRLAIYLRTFFPSLYFYIMKNRAKRLKS
uniref:Ketoreductase domain-containing protein n=1 Tax=Clastoptera arizonana TaxID=38151 RepID=A0A1B6CN93_9HEMI